MADRAVRKLLYVGASPSDLDRVDVGQIGEIIKREMGAADVRIELAVACTWRDFRRLLMTHDPDYLHVGCHGRAGGFYFLGRDNTKHYVGGDNFIEALKTARRLRWVVLNTCSSGATAERIAQARSIPVIGMADDISAQPSLEYTEGFYIAFNAGRAFEDAHAEGGRSIRFYCNDADIDSEENIPTLYPPSPARIEPRSVSTAPHEVRPSDEPLTTIESDLLTRLRALIGAHLERHSDLCHALAHRIQVERTPGATAEALLQMDAYAIIESLIEVVRVAGSMAQSGRSFAQLILPVVTNWGELSRARMEAQAAGATHLTLPFLTGPLCEVALAGLHGRSADLSDEHGGKAAVRAPAGLGLPLRHHNRSARLLVAESILRKAGLSPEAMPRDPDQLLIKAKQVIEHNRDKRALDDRYQMYLVYRDAEHGALAELHGGLPDLWLVCGTGAEDNVSMLMFLRELYQWPKAST